MALQHSGAASLPQLFAPPPPPAPLISWKQSSALVLHSCTPAEWAQRTAWDVRESNLDRFLDAKHGSTIEEFWSPEYIENVQGGREYCEKLLQYIIMFNHEEVGGHAVMFIDQMVMWDPKYFPEAMKLYCSVDQLFEPDQIAHYGRKFLEKVTEWCHIAYTTNQQYWDNLFYNPPTRKAREDFLAIVHAQHTPQRLKERNIVPACRPNDWPSNYFALARNKTAVPQAQIEMETTTSKHQLSEESSPDVSKKNHQVSKPKDADENTDTDTRRNDSATGSTDQQSTSSVNGSKSAITKDSCTSIGGSADDGEESDADDRKRSMRDSKLPASPKSKKSLLQPEDGSESKAYDATVHRRSISEPESPSKRPELKAAEWMTAPGVERRAVSDEKQSKQLEKAMRAQVAHPNRIPNTGRGGAQAAIGQYQYGPGASVPTFTHPYSRDQIMQNNAAYLYHQDHSFGRTYPPQPDHSTTYRPGSNIYRTDPQTGAMFMPVPHPQAHYSQAQAYPGAHNPMRGFPQQHAPNQMPPGIHAGQSPHLGQVAYAHPIMTSPQVVQTAPHGVVPNHIMAPYIQLAAQGAMPHSEPRLSQVGQPPIYPGYPPMRQPSQYVARAAAGQMFSPQPMHSPAQPSPRPSMQHQTMAVRGGASVATPHMGQRNSRRDGMRSEPMSYSPNAPNFHPGGAFRPAAHGHASMLPNANAPVFIANENLPPRARRGSQVMPRHASGSGPMLPFPSYMDDMLDPTDLPESQQCTSTTIGPDAEDVVTLWFADIPPESTVEQLRACITHKMNIADIRDPICYSADQQYSKGWTFVKFLSNKDARDALTFFQGHPFNGGHLKVQVPERRTHAGAGRPRKSSSFHGNHQAQSSDNSDAYAGPRGPSGGNSTPGRPQPFPHGSFGASPGPRRPRGSSLVQANHAVRRNSAFSKQDARSDLPLPDLLELSEPSKPSKPATPVPAEHSSAVYDDEHVDAVKKPGKKKPKPRKTKNKNKTKGSRDTSVAPSESTVTEALSRASPAVGPVEEADIVLVPKATTYASIATGQQVADPVLQNSADTDVAVVAEVGHEASELVVKPITTDTEENAEPAVVDAKENAEPEVEPESEPITPPLADKEGISEPTGAADLVIAKEEAYVENNEVVDTRPSTEQLASELGEGDAVASVADMSDVQSEATTVTQNQLVAAPAKEIKFKSKGPAQTQTMSAFAIAKNQKKAEKNQAKKARKASRKVSKAPTNATAANAADDDDTDLPENKLVASTSHAAEKKDSAKVESRDKMHREISESSSMAGTPKTAQEYPDSAPGTPTPRTSAGSLASQAAQTPKEDDSALEETTGPGEGGSTTTRRRSTIVGGELSSSTNREKDVEPDTSRTQPSKISGHDAGPQLKKEQQKRENSKPMTWAQTVKGTKNTTTTAMNETGLGLVERSVNVQR